MKEIKFRAWDGKKFGYVTLHPRSIHVPVSEYWPRSSYSADHISFFNLEDWQQSTGLKDKSGKEIYEGDVLRPTFADVAEVVTFERSSFSTRLGFDLAKAEVIGNIYENPDLLK